MKRLLGVVFGIFLVSGTAFAGFKDTGGHMWQESVEYLQTSGIVQGYSDNTFKPDNTVNRAEFTKMVVMGLLGEVDDSKAGNCFKDVKSSDWFSKYVCYAKELGIVNGNPDGTYKPGTNIKQPEALKIIFNTLGEVVPATSGEWYWQWLDYAENLGMFYFNAYDPASYEVTRAETSYFIAWLINADLKNQIPSLDFYYEVDGFYDMTAADCFPGESYDPDFKYCYVACDTVEECDAAYAAIDEYAQGIFDEYSYDESQAGLEWADGEEVLYASYDVDENNITLVNGEDDPMDYEIWNLFVKLIPARFREEISQFLIVSDGRDGTMASVEMTDDDYTKWVLNVDTEDAYPDGVFDKGETTYTLIHEFAHVLTLNSKQIDPIFAYDEAEFEVEKSKCLPNYYVWEGCTKTNSYFNKFYQKFWKNIYDERMELESITDNEAYLIARNEFSAKYEDWFTTGYASENPGEDIADSFTAFVLNQKPKSSLLIKDQKVLFFYDYPELVTLRELIRKGL